MRNWIDRAIGSVAPQYGVRRLHAREVLRSYDAAQTGRRVTGFGTIGGSANSNIGTALSRLRDRSSAMVRNTGHGFAIVDVLVRNLVGAGIRPVFNTGSDRADRQVGQLWDYAVERADVEGELTLYAQQELAVRGMVERGDALLRLIDLPRGEDPRLPTRVQLLEGDLIDNGRNSAIGGNLVRLGVALDARRRRVGYYLFPEHPGEGYSVAPSALVPRSQVQHLYRPMRAGQVVGVPWLAPVLLSSADLADLLKFTIVKAQVEASFAGYIKNSGSMPSPLQTTTDADTGDKVMMPEPGTLYNLKSGQEITFPSLSAPGQFETTSTAVLRAMAAGVGLTYDQATGDLRQANYSSLRAGKIEHRRFVEQVQFNCIIPRICNPIANHIIDRAILAGTLRARPDGYPRSWVPPANEPIDPKKDLEADINAVRAGRMSPQEFIGQWGNDWRKVVADSAEFWKAVDAAGLKFDIDPRSAKPGAAAAADPAADPTDPPADPNNPDDPANDA